MDLEEAIKRLSMKATISSVEAPDYPNCIVMKKDLITILNHLTKQEKMIDTIITELAYYDNYICHSIECKDIGCRECLKQYFEKKAEEIK